MSEAIKSPALPFDGQMAEIAVGMNDPLPMCTRRRTFRASGSRSLQARTIAFPSWMGV
jgi:hypothetical protein